MNSEEAQTLRQYVARLLSLARRELTPVIVLGNLAKWIDENDQSKCSVCKGTGRFEVPGTGVTIRCRACLPDQAEIYCGRCGGNRPASEYDHGEKGFYCPTCRTTTTLSVVLK